MGDPLCAEDQFWRAFGGGADGKSTVGNVNTWVGNLSFSDGCG